MLQYLTAITQKIVLHNSTFPTAKVIIKIQRGTDFMEHCVQPHAYETQRYFSPTKPVTSTQHRQNPNTHTTHKTLN